MAARARERRRGQAVVEFALILPVLLLLVFAVTEFGRAYSVVHNLTNAAREAAKVAALPDSDETDVSDSVDAFLEHVGLPQGLWTTSVVVRDSEGSVRAGGLDDAETGDRVSVTIDYDFEVVSGTIIPSFQGTVALHGNCVFRHE